MKEQQLQLVTFEQAKKLKQLGFDWGIGNIDSLLIDSDCRTFTLRESPNGVGFLSPTVALALKWLRDEKKIFINSYKYRDNFYSSIILPNYSQANVTPKGLISFEQSESAGLDYAFDYLIKQSLPEIKGGEVIFTDEKQFDAYDKAFKKEK